VAIQCHLDMVCEKEVGVAHDFFVDPIQARREGDRIFALGTTLGADNGIGVSAALSLITTPGLQHGPLELIFTVEEETGLYGAAAFDASHLRSRLLINLDTEDPRSLTVGSAGGATVIVSVDAVQERPERRWVGRQLNVSGLKGGHSGLQIGQRLGNAIKLLTKTLTAARSAGICFQIASIQGGTVDNAIPRQCGAVLGMSSLSATKFDDLIKDRQKSMLAALAADEPSVRLEARECPAPDRVWSGDLAEGILELLENLPYGALKMSEEFTNTVETSANVAIIRTASKSIEIVLSARSSVDVQLDTLLAEFSVQAQKIGALIETRDKYPAWQPNLNSPLLTLAEKAFYCVHGTAPVIQVMHGGLECGLIVSKVPEMDAISIGPLIRYAHTPQEDVSISSVVEMWAMLTTLLKALSEAEPSVLQPSRQNLEVYGIN
jgi:dipeptidase D